MPYITENIKKIMDLNNLQDSNIHNNNIIHREE